MIDKEYIESLLSNAFKISIEFNEVNGDHLGHVRFVFDEEWLGKSAIYYMLLRLRNENILITLSLTKENELYVKMDIKDKGIIIEVKNKNCNTLDVSNYLNRGIAYNTTKVFVCCMYQKGFKQELIYIEDDNLKAGTRLASITCLLYNTSNEGFELIL